MCGLNKIVWWVNKLVQDLYSACLYTITKEEGERRYGQNFGGVGGTKVNLGFLCAGMGIGTCTQKGGQRADGGGGEKLEISWQ